MENDSNAVELVIGEDSYEASRELADVFAEAWRSECSCLPVIETGGKIRVQVRDEIARHIAQARAALVTKREDSVVRS